LPSNAQAPSPVAQEQRQPNIIARRWIRLPQSVYGTMLRTGVSTPSDFAPKRLRPFVRSMDEHMNPQVNSGNFLMWLTGGREKVEALLNFMTAAEVRFASACACVYPDDDERAPPVPKPPVETLGGRKKRHLKPVS
jgi:hypothetical protein